MQRAIIFIFFSLVSWSCTKDADDFDTKRNNIIGSWEITQATQEIRADTVYAEGSTSFDITFNADGTGERIILGFPANFEWLYQFNPEKVVIIQDQAPIGGSILLSSVQYYDVIKNESDRQIWEFEVVLENQVVDKYKHTWKMDRK